MHNWTSRSRAANPPIRGYFVRVTRGVSPSRLVRHTNQNTNARTRTTRARPPSRHQETTETRPQPTGRQQTAKPDRQDRNRNQRDRQTTRTKRNTRTTKAKTDKQKANRGKTKRQAEQPNAEPTRRNARPRTHSTSSVSITGPGEPPQGSPLLASITRVNRVRCLSPPPDSKLIQ